MRDLTRESRTKYIVYDFISIKFHMPRVMKKTFPFVFNDFGVCAQRKENDCSADRIINLRSVYEIVHREVAAL